MTYWKEKTALVTGASAGLGRSIAQALARQGACVVMAARNEEQLNEAAKRLKNAGGQVHAIAADVTCQQDVDRLIEEAISRQGALDLLVNNVGRSSRGAALDVSPEQFAEFFEVNVLSAVRCTRAAAPHLIASKGHLVNIGSLACKSASPLMGAYPVSKFPLAAYSQQLRLELSAEGVHVLLVCPGPLARDDAGARYNDAAQGLPPEAKRPGGGVKLKLLDPDRLSERILTACEKRQAELVVPAKARLLFALSQLSPGWGDWVIRRMTKK